MPRLVLFGSVTDERIGLAGKDSTSLVGSMLGVQSRQSFPHAPRMDYQADGISLYVATCVTASLHSAHLMAVAITDARLSRGVTSV